MKSGTLKLAGRLYLAALLVIYTLVVWNARDLILQGYPDFTIYYTAGTMLRQGLGHSLYDNTRQYEVQQEFAPRVATRMGALPFNHPPFEAILLLPFAYLPYRLAYFLWTLANLAILTVLPRLVRPYVSGMERWSAARWSLLSIAFFPIFFALLQGQDAILLMLLYGLAFVALKRERLWWAGACLAGGLFKFHLVLPFVFLLLLQQRTWPRRGKILAGFTLVASLLAVISLAAVGIHQILAYPHYVLTLEETMAKGAIMPSDMPNLRGVLYLIASKLPHLDLLSVALSGIIFFVAAWISFSNSKNDRDDNLKFALAVFATVLVSYHGLGYDLCILALPIVLLGATLKNTATFTWTQSINLTALAGLLFAPLHLVLLLRYNHLALIGWFVLLAFVGIAGELRSRVQTPA